MWRIVFGSIAGVLLATLRAPEGLGLFTLPGVPAWQSYTVRAIALLAIALAALLGRNLFAAGRSNADLLWATALGFVLYSFSPETGASITWTSLLVPPAIFVVFVVKWLDPRAALVDPTPPPRRAWVLRLGLFIGGVGVAIACEGLARHLLLLGAGESGDEGVFGASFLILLAFGGLAFGSFLKALAGDRAKAPAALVCLPLAAAAGWIGVSALQSMSTTRDLDRFARGLGLTTSDHGMLHFDAALAAPVLVATAFLLGTALYCARRRSEFSAILGGAGVGLLLVPALLALPESDVADATFSTRLVGVGALVSAAGALFAAVLAAGVGVAGRLVLVASALAAGFLGPWHSSTPLVILSPWEIRPVIPELVFQGPEGLFTVEPSGPGFLHATLDRRHLSPDFEAAAADAQRIRRSWDVLPDGQPGQEVSVLLIGQLTPGRALALTDLGATTIDRTAAWHAAMPALEAQLFGSGSIPLPSGSVLPIDVASDRFSSGGYDLVIVPPVPGRAPCIPELRPLSSSTRVVAWFDAGERLAWREIEQPVMLSAHEFGQLSVGIVWGADGSTALGRVNAGHPDSAPGPIEWLRLREYEREFRSQAAMSRRLAAANAEGPNAALTAGLAEHYAAQHHSSPFENEAQQIEMTAASLEFLREAALATTPGPFVREIWNGIAGLLVGKRAIEEIYEYIGPIAEKWGPWYELELALAEAELEALEPAAAAARLTTLLTAHPGDGPASELLARTHTDQGQFGEAARILRDLLARSFGDPRIERRLGLVLFEAEDPEGRAILERIFEADPDDVEVGALLYPERDWTAPHR